LLKAPFVRDEQTFQFDSRSGPRQGRIFGAALPNAYPTTGIGRRIQASIWLSGYEYMP
jgi:hypothetical protein